MRMQMILGRMNSLLHSLYGIAVTESCKHRKSSPHEHVQNTCQFSSQRFKVSLLYSTFKSQLLPFFFFLFFLKQSFMQDKPVLNSKKNSELQTHFSLDLSIICVPRYVWHQSHSVNYLLYRGTHFVSHEKSEVKSELDKATSQWINSLYFYFVVISRPHGHRSRHSHRHTDTHISCHRWLFWFSKTLRMDRDPHHSGSKGQRNKQEN